MKILKFESSSSESDHKEYYTSFDQTVSTDHHHKQSCEIYFALKDPIFGVTIRKLKDEWFTISITPTGSPGFERIVARYKCDQLLGVEMCIKDELTSRKRQRDIEDRTKKVTHSH
jgi:hypothetical protein